MIQLRGIIMLKKEAAPKKWKALFIIKVSERIKGGEAAGEGRDEWGIRGQIEVSPILLGKPPCTKNRRPSVCVGVDKEEKIL